MRLGTEISEPTPLVAVPEVSGAVLAWIIDDPAGAGAARITFTDPSRADWLWRVIGESAHLALMSGEEPDEIAVTPGSLAPLHRLAVGHWLRRWWPASQRDGIAGLDRALLDVEVALLTVGTQDFFTDDTLDSDVTELLAPHPAALIDHARAADPRVRELVRAGAELADEVGMDDFVWAELAAVVEDSGLMPATTAGFQEDYALAAGSGPGTRAGTAIGLGAASINWSAVPPGIFDAAEHTVDWSVAASGPAVVAVVHAAVVGPEPATAIPVRVQSGVISGAAALDAGGRANVPLLDGGQALSETVAWNHDWRATTVVVGADATEPREIRDRIRRWARSRLGSPPTDAFLAEMLAAESAY